jgi:hypothetical protein
MLLADVTGTSYRSIYSQVGEWLNISLILLALTVGVASRGKAKKSRRK